MFGLHALSAEQPIKYMFTAGVRNPICSHQKSHTLTKKQKLKQTYGTLKTTKLKATHAITLSMENKTMLSRENKTTKVFYKFHAMPNRRKKKHYNVFHFAPWQAIYDAMTNYRGTKKTLLLHISRHDKLSREKKR